MMATGIRGIAKAAFACVLALALVPAAMAAGAVEGERGFDHLKTGFALIGAHQSARCESCHVRGVLRGTPRDCASCHGAGARIVVVDIEGEVVGLAAERVSKVTRLAETLIRPPPPLVSGIAAEYLRGVARVGDRFLIFLHLPRLLATDAPEDARHVS